MKIVFYSTNSNYYDENSMIYTTRPSFEEQWEQFKLAHKSDTFKIYTQKPGMFLPLKSPDVSILPTDDTNEIAKTIINEQPDIAIAVSFWTTPFDWLPVKDSLVANQLRENGIKVICHSVQTASLCFDKWETHNFLEKNSFNFARGVFVKHDLYFCAGNQKDVKENVYKECVLAQIKQLNFPVIIKDNVGLSSYGMAVANTFGEVCNYLNSKKNNSDRIVEEYLSGPQFGVEIYGTQKCYSVLPLFSFSMNKYGITSPKLSQKNGPVSIPEFSPDIFKQLAHKLDLCGVAQVDLVLHEGKWYIIEINPRLSGMTLTYCASCGLSIYEMIYRTCILEKQLDVNCFNQVENKKMPLMTQKEIDDYLKNNKPCFISQIENKAYKQEREKGYCEVISKA